MLPSTQIQRLFVAIPELVHVGKQILRGEYALARGRQPVTPLAVEMPLDGLWAQRERLRSRL